MKMKSEMYLLLCAHIFFIFTLKVCYGQQTYACPDIVDHVHSLEGGPTSLMWPTVPSYMSNNINLCYWEYRTCPNCPNNDEFLGYDKVKEKRLNISSRHHRWGFVNNSFPCVGGIHKSATIQNDAGCYRIQVRISNDSMYQSPLIRLHVYSGNLTIGVDVDNTSTTMSIKGAKAGPVEIDPLARHTNERSAITVRLNGEFPPSTVITITKEQEGKTDCIVQKCFQLTECVTDVLFDEAGNFSIVIHVDTGIHSQRMVRVIQTFEIEGTAESIQTLDCTAPIVIAGISSVLLCCHIVCLMVLLPNRIHGIRKSKHDMVNQCGKEPRDDSSILLGNYASNTDKTERHHTKLNTWNSQSLFRQEHITTGSDHSDDSGIDRETQTDPESTKHSDECLSLGASSKNSPAVIPSLTLVHLAATLFPAGLQGMLSVRESKFVSPIDARCLAISKDGKNAALVTSIPASGGALYKKGSYAMNVSLYVFWDYATEILRTTFHSLGDGVLPSICWSSDGTIIATFVDPAEEQWYIVKYDAIQNIEIWNIPSEFRYINDLAADHEGNVYCCDVAGDCIYKYTKDAKENDPNLYKLKARGKYLASPRSLCMYGRSRLLVLCSDKAEDTKGFVATVWDSDHRRWSYIDTILRIPNDEDPRFIRLQSDDDKHNLIVSYVDKTVVRDITIQLRNLGHNEPATPGTGCLDPTRWPRQS